MIGWKLLAAPRIRDPCKLRGRHGVSLLGTPVLRELRFFFSGHYFHSNMTSKAGCLILCQPACLI